MGIATLRRRPACARQGPAHRLRRTHLELRPILALATLTTTLAPVRLDEAARPPGAAGGLPLHLAVATLPARSGTSVTSRITASRPPLGQAKQETASAPLSSSSADGTNSTTTRPVHRHGLCNKANAPAEWAWPTRYLYKNPRHTHDWLESWLERVTPTSPTGCCRPPGYGWIFGMAAGTIEHRPGHPHTCVGVSPRDDTSR